ncbi:MbnH family di-heme enzyme [Ferruginibacter sp. SUN002]|uniref:MbnH family di-heme enzyme n=1 Tax=Ferruginibacter sp. SUN002 TaxID=2937789 RepID=UPI003D36AC9A
MKKNIFLVIICITVVSLAGYILIACSTKGVEVQGKKEVLGRYLFYDRRLSVNNSKSCGTCHNPNLAFTDGYKRSLGAYADLHQRNTQPLFNLSSFKYLTAADSTIHLTIQQMSNPLFNEHPKEMGVKGHEEEILKKIANDPLYIKLFADAFPDDKNIFNWNNIKLSISAFMQTIISNQSAYDRYIGGNKNALSSSQKNGMQLFFSNRLNCSSCHGGFNFSSPVVINAKKDTVYYFNTGLYNIDGKGAYPAYDMGLYQLTKNNTDMGRFRVPTLRNLAFTAPYFHDGSAADLGEVIDMYASGGRVISTGIYAGDGTKNPYKDPLVKGFPITESEKIDLLNFLQSLTDSSLINDVRFSNPFVEDETKKKY